MGNALAAALPQRGTHGNKPKPLTFVRAAAGHSDTAAVRVMESHHGLFAGIGTMSHGREREVPPKPWFKRRVGRGGTRPSRGCWKGSWVVASRPAVVSWRRVSL